MTGTSLKAAFNAACDRFYELADNWQTTRTTTWNSVIAARDDVYHARDQLTGANLSYDEWDDVIIEIVAISDFFERLKPTGP